MRSDTAILIATGTEVLRVEAGDGTFARSKGAEVAAPTCLAADPHRPHRCWCGTARDGVRRSEDGGRTWRPSGLEGRAILSLAASPVRPGLLWAGTEPSAVWRSDDGGDFWHPTRDLTELPSSSTWAFPPRPDTHHARWIACHPRDEDRLWVAVEAGALVSTEDGGATWRDRVPGGPRDTHELAIHAELPETLRVAAGDGYFESSDGGATWRRPMEGLDVGYLRSVAVDPGDSNTVLVSAASRPKSAYVADRSDGRLYRRAAGEPWERVTVGWPDPPATIAPLIRSGAASGELWAADERGLHRSTDGGRRWDRAIPFEPAPANLRGLSVLAPSTAG